MKSVSRWFHYTDTLYCTVSKTKFLYSITYNYQYSEDAPQFRVGAESIITLGSRTHVCKTNYIKSSNLEIKFKSDVFTLIRNAWLLHLETLCIRGFRFRKI
jgi:hypothetical protein